MSKLDGHKIINCHECGGTIFDEGMMMLSKSKFLTGELTDTIVQVPVIFCKNCSEIVKFMADDMDDILELEKVNKDIKE